MSTEFFYGGPLSQWCGSVFSVDGVTYNCAEQYMMAQKARLFRDSQALVRVMRATDPAEQKLAGRAVKDYSDEIWHAVARDVVVRGNLAKFSQNPTLRRYLDETGHALLVEASPTDRIWGIGYDEHDAPMTRRLEWGRNWLGLCLMEVREALRVSLVGTRCANARTDVQ